MKKSWHEQQICNLMKKCPRVKKNGFYKTLREVFKEDGWGGDPLTARNYGYIPDAYIVNEDAMNIVVFEVVDHHKITRERMCCITELWFGLDCEGWDMQMVAIYKHGRMRVDVTDNFYEQLYSRVA